MFPPHRWLCPPPRACQQNNNARRLAREAVVSKCSLIYLCVSGHHKMQQHAAVWTIPLLVSLGLLKVGHCRGPWCQPHDTGYFVTQQWPSAACFADQESKPALQGCFIAECENVDIIHKCGGVAPPCLAGGGCSLSMATACQQLIYGGLALAAGGKTQRDMHPCQVWGKGLSNASVCSTHLSGELTVLWIPIKQHRIGKSLAGTVPLGQHASIPM